MSDQPYRVEEIVKLPGECQCPACQEWTITYDDPEPTDIGQSWTGEDGKETAEDIADLMNMAFALGLERSAAPKEAK